MRLSSSTPFSGVALISIVVLDFDIKLADTGWATAYIVYYVGEGYP